MPGIEGVLKSNSANDGESVSTARCMRDMAGTSGSSSWPLEKKGS